MLSDCSKRQVAIANTSRYSPHRPAGFAHHSFGAEYNSAKPVTLTGAVTKIGWSNPHVYIFLDVKGDNGQIANALKENDTITVTGMDVKGWKQSDRWPPGDSPGRPKVVSRAAGAIREPNDEDRILAPDRRDFGLRTSSR